MPLPDRDVGLGTAYERVAVYRLVERWCGPSPPATALEGPIDGMAGMPGLHLLPLAARGTRVTVVTPERAVAERVRVVYARAGLSEVLDVRVGSGVPDERFDLVWSFNALSLVERWRPYLEALLAATRRRLVLVVTNRDSYGALLRRGLSVVTPSHRRGSALFDHETTRRAILEDALGGRFGVRDAAWVDCPWWPDLFVIPGQTLWGATGGRLLPSGRPLSPRFVFAAHTFPYLGADPPPVLAPALARHPVFDGAPPPLGRLFGHHRALLIAPD